MIRETLHLSSVTLGIPEHELVLIYDTENLRAPVGVARKASGERWRFVDSLEGLEPWPDPMPPFPQEPALGSPEAVAQAAETIRKPFAGPDDSETATCWDCGHTWKRGQNGSHSCVSRLQSERDALQAEVERLRGILASITTQRDAMEIQGNALAVALLACYHAEIEANKVIEDIMGVPTPPSPWLVGAEAALRLAGRLPTTTKGEPDGPHA